MLEQDGKENGKQDQPQQQPQQHEEQSWWCNDDQQDQDTGIILPDGSDDPPAAASPNVKEAIAQQSNLPLDSSSPSQALEWQQTVLMIDDDDASDQYVCEHCKAFFFDASALSEHLKATHHSTHHHRKRPRDSMLITSSFITSRPSSSTTSTSTWLGSFSHRQQHRHKKPPSGAPTGEGTHYFSEALQRLVVGSLDVASYLKEIGAKRIKLKLWQEEEEEQGRDDNQKEPVDDKERGMYDDGQKPREGKRNAVFGASASSLLVRPNINKADAISSSISTQGKTFLPPSLGIEYDDDEDRDVSLRTTRTRRGKKTRKRV